MLGGVRATLLGAGVVGWVMWVVRSLADGLLWVAEVLAILIVQPPGR